MNNDQSKNRNSDRKRRHFYGHSAVFGTIKQLLISSPSIKEEKSEESEEQKQIVKRGALVCMFFTLGVLFSFAEMPFGAYPLGIALVGGASSHVFTLSLGMLCGIFSAKLQMSHFLSLAVLIFVRILGRTLLDKPSYSIKNDIWNFIRYDLFTENIYLRLSAVSVAAFSLGLWGIIANDFRFYDLWGALIGMILSPACAYLFSLFFDSENSGARAISIGGFLLFSVYALRQIDGIGMFLAVTAAEVATITLARILPPIRVLAMALLFGICCGMEYTPMFFLSAIAFILVEYLTKRHSKASLAVGLAVCVGYAFIADARTALYTVFPAILAAAAIDELIQACVPGIGIVCCDEFVSAKTKQSLMTTKEAEERLTRMSESFSNLSRSFKRLSDRLSHPGVYEIRRECDDIIESYCCDCKNSSVCWGEDYNTTIGFLTSISTHLGSSGTVDIGFAPKSLRDRCSSIDKIIHDVNEKTKLLYRDTQKREKLTVFSADYNALSSVISDSIAQRRAENSENAELSEKALTAMGKYLNDFHTVSVWGKRRIRVFARLKTLSENTVGMREFRQIMEKVCDCSFSNPTLKIEGKSMTVTLGIKPNFKAEAASSAESAEKGSMCGDTPTFFEGHDDYFYALISDGMGTGPNAALTSGICEVFLREMLEGGNRVETSLRMLNSVLGAKSDECSATVDIMEFDLLNGRASFIKSGAASSFILREGNVYRLSARTMPLGILDDIDADMQKVRLCDGDLVFLVSDGNAPMDNYARLIELIKETKEDEELSHICERIIKSSRSVSRDDLSCVVIRISRA